MIKSSDLWAKTEPFENVESHLLKTGLVCQVALQYSTLKHIWNILKSNITFENETNLLNFISYIVAMHDIGKVSPFFQEKDERMAELLEAEELSQEYSGIFQHECQSNYYMYDIFKKRGIDKKYISKYSKVVGLHHERIFNKGKSIALDSDIEDFWLDCVNEIEEFVYSYFPFNSQSIGYIHNQDVFFNILQGLIIICDWIASSEEFNLYSVEDIIKNNQIIVDILKKYGLGIQKVNWIDINYSSLLNVPLDALKLRPIQEWTQDYFKNNSYDFMIVEAGTGEGKSSVGLYSAMQNMNIEDGFYFALPMKSMVNSKYRELEEIFKPFNMPITLLHGSRDLVEGVSNEYSYIENETNKNIAVSSFLTSSTRRGLLNKYIIGTIDQLLFSVLSNRYSILRLIGLVGKTIILDEIHTYDAYTSSLICVLLQWCKALNIKIILMSATLTKNVKEKYLNSYLGTNIELKSIDYPLVTVCKKNKVMEIPIQGSEKNKSINLKYFDCIDDINRQYDLIKELYDKNTNIIVYKNTVNSAQELYKVCKNNGIENILLCHSRFTVEDRAKIEKKVLQLFGKNSSNRPDKFVIISTQVLEASMDIDLDMGFSDIAPIDILFQRMGRVCRFNLVGNNRNMFYIFGSKNKKFGVSSLIYPEIFLYNTENYLSNKDNIELPAELRNSIETVYKDIDFSNDEILKLFIEYRTKEGIKESQGKVVAILPPNETEYTKMVKDYLILDEDKHQNYVGASTRIFSPSFTVLLIDKKELIRYNIDKITKREYQELMKKTVSLSANYISFAPQKGYTKLYKGKKWLKNIFIMEMQDNEYLVDSEKLQGYRYSKELGLEYIRE